MKKPDISSGGTSVGNELSRSRSESARNTIGIHYTKYIINTCHRVSSAKRIYEIVERSKIVVFFPFTTTRPIRKQFKQAEIMAEVERVMKIK